MKVLALCFLFVMPIAANNNYTINWIEQQVDHFSYGVQNVKFHQRYLVNADHWNSSHGAIFFYTGNEGDIELFAQNTGFLYDIAPLYNALIVFAEHRYYGQSMPFGKKAYKHKQYYQYQSSMQALADYATLITHIKSSYHGADKAPVIAFGGSYGGMLAAWFRIKYPNLVQGAIAASAPVAQFTNLTACNAFGEVVTKTFAKTQFDCVDVIRSSWKYLDTITSTPTGMRWLSNDWKLCKPLANKEDVTKLKAFLTDVWGNLAMADYPYPANFLAHLPAYPVQAVCQNMKMEKANPEATLHSLYEGLNVYTNFSQQLKCLQYEDANPGSLSNRGWELQSCTEMVMPMCYDGKRDFFEPTPWSLEQYAKECKNTWETEIEPFKMEIIYGGRQLSDASNIVFSNGDLDPWHAGGVLVDQNPTVVAVMIKNGAHHLDLRGAMHADPPSVVEARGVHKTHITRWIQEYRQRLAYTRE